MRKKLLLVFLAVAAVVVAAVIAERSNRTCIRDGEVMPLCVQ
jgi:hypothetical protein